MPRAKKVTDQKVTVQKSPDSPFTDALTMVVIGVALLGAFMFFRYITAPKSDTARACTEEAKACPDGSMVGRHGPKCEFDPCPVKHTGPVTYSINGGKFVRVQDKEERVIIDPGNLGNSSTQKIFSFDISPDNKKLCLINGKEPGQAGMETYKMYTATVDGTNIKYVGLTGVPKCYWSHDSLKIAYNRRIPGSPLLSFSYYVLGQPGAVSPLAGKEKYATKTFHEPAWSDDDKAISISYSNKITDNSIAGTLKYDIESGNIAE